MSALNSLVRVHTWGLNEKRHKLAELDAYADKLRNKLAALEREMETERRAADKSLEGTAAFPAFVAAALERRRRLRESLANIEQAVELAREEVNAAYRELKKYQLAYDNYLLREAEESARREREELDEIGVDLHRRAQDRPGGPDGRT